MTHVLGQMHCIHSRGIHLLYSNCACLARGAVGWAVQGLVPSRVISATKPSQYMQQLTQTYDVKVPGKGRTQRATVVSSCCPAAWTVVLILKCEYNSLPVARTECKPPKQHAPY